MSEVRPQLKRPQQTGSVNTARIPYLPTEIWLQIYGYAASEWVSTLTCPKAVHQNYRYWEIIHGTTWRLPRPQPSTQGTEHPTRIKLKIRQLPAAFSACNLSRIVFYDVLKEKAMEGYFNGLKMNRWIFRYNVPRTPGQSRGEWVMVATLPEELRPKE